MYYFFTSPDYLIVTHRPDSDTYQFLPKTLTYKQFLNRRYSDFGKFYQNAYETQIIMEESHRYPLLYWPENPYMPIKKGKEQEEMVLCFYKAETYFMGEIYKANNKGVYEKLGEIRSEYNEDDSTKLTTPIISSSEDSVILSLLNLR